jgi:hypothetical protein
MQKISPNDIYEKIDNWKKEFYPVNVANVPVEQALDHSIKKWDGLTEENLAKHGLTAAEFKEYFPVSAETCALCFHYDGAGRNCSGCPLFHVRGETRCDEEMDDEEDSPFHRFSYISIHNPQPMIEGLRKAKKYEKESKGERSKN